MIFQAGRRTMARVIVLAFVFLMGCVSAQQPIQQPIQQPNQLPDQEPKAADNAPQLWTTNWSFDDIDIGKLFSRLESIGIEIPIEAVGDVSVGFEVSIPVTEPGNAKAYRLQGRIASKRLQLDALLLEDFNADVVYDEGTLTLRNVNGHWIDAAAGDEHEPGKFSAEATLALVPRGNAAIQLDAQSLKLAPVCDLVFNASGISIVRQVEGELSGRLNLGAPVDALSDPSTWNAKADLQIRNVRRNRSLPLSLLTGPVAIQDGIVKAPNVAISSPAAAGVQADVSAHVELTGRRRFAFQLRGNDVPLDALSSLVSVDPAAQSTSLADGKLDLDLRGQGELGSETWQIDGRIGSPQLKLLGQDFGLLEHRLEFNQQTLLLSPIHGDSKHGDSKQGGADAVLMPIGRLTANYRVTKSRIDITDLTADVFGGRVAGNATLPRQASGSYRFDLSWNELVLSLDPANLLPVPMSRSIANITASTSGRFDWTIPSDSLFFPSRHRGNAEVSMASIAIGKAELGDVEVSLSAVEGAIDLSGSGNLFGGKLSIETKTAVDPDDDWSTWLQRIPAGKIQIESAKLDLVMPLLRPKDQRRFRGTVSAIATMSPSANDASEAGHEVDTGIGKDSRVVVDFSAEGLAVDGRPLSRGIEGTMRWVDGNLLIDRVTGSYADGRIDASGRWSLGGRAKSEGDRVVQLRFSDIDVKDGLMPFSQTLSNQVAGQVSGNLTVSGQQDFRVRGVINARDSALFSVATGAVHSGVRGSFTGDLARWQICLAGITGDLAGGQISGQAEVSSSTGLRDTFDLTSRWSVRRVNFGELAAQAGSSTSLANGNISGTMSIGGQRIRSVADLTGQFAADLEQTQASAIPGLIKANRFLGAVSLAQTQFDRGEVHGTIGQGAFHIKEFWVRSDRVRVFADGRIGISDMRMDMDAVVATGFLDVDNAKILALAGQLAIESFIPIAALVEINRLFSNRTVYFNVTGPTSDPRLQLKPLETIRKEAARFLVREALVLITAGNRIQN